MLEKYPLKVFDSDVVNRPFILTPKNCVVQHIYTTSKPNEVHFHIADNSMYDTKNNWYNGSNGFTVKAVFRIKHVYIKLKKCIVQKNM